MRIPSNPGLAVAGLIAGLLFVWPGAGGFFAKIGLDHFVGAVFGIAVSAYCWLTRRSTSPWKALVLMAVSAMAYRVAVMATIFVHQYTERPATEPASVVMLVGGAVGAFLLSATVLLLYGSHRDRLWTRVLICTVGGSVLGAASYAVGVMAEPLGQSGNIRGLATMHVLWQAGLGALLESVWPVAAFQARDAEAEAAGIVSPRSRVNATVPLSGKVVIGLILAVFAWELAWDARLRYSRWQQRKEVVAYQRRRPSLEGLPPLTAPRDDEVLILAPIAGRTVDSFHHRLEPARADRPEAMEYSVCYMHEPEHECGATPPAVDVRVRVHPNPEWAAYEVEGMPLGPGYVSGSKNVRRLTLFGQPIRNANLLVGHEDFYWRSGRFVVRIMSSIPDPHEFIRQYLERYPSSE